MSNQPASWRIGGGENPTPADVRSALGGDERVGVLHLEVAGVLDEFKALHPADDHVGILLSKLDDLGVLDDTAVLVSSDHGEGFGELGVYADHQAADQENP